MTTHTAALNSCPRSRLRSSQVASGRAFWRPGRMLCHSAKRIQMMLSARSWRPLTTFGSSIAEGSRELKIQKKSPRSVAGVRLRTELIIYSSHAQGQSGFVLVLACHAFARVPSPQGVVRPRLEVIRTSRNRWRAALSAGCCGRARGPFSSRAANTRDVVWHPIFGVPSTDPTDLTRSSYSIRRLMPLGPTSRGSTATTLRSCRALATSWPMPY
jgi:hypothetical protein